MIIEESSVAARATRGGEAEVANLGIGTSKFFVGPRKVESLHSSFAVHTDVCHNESPAPAENGAGLCRTSGCLTKVIKLWPPAGGADFEGPAKCTD